MRLKTLIRPDLLTYFLATIVFVAQWPHRYTAIDIQLHNSYYVFSYGLFFMPLTGVLIAMGAVYSIVIRLGRIPSKGLSWIFIALTITSLIGIQTLFPPPVVTHYYTFQELDKNLMVSLAIFTAIFLLGILSFGLSLMRSGRTEHL